MSHNHDDREEPLLRKQARGTNGAAENVCNEEDVQQPPLVKVLHDTAKIAGNDMKSHLAQSVVSAQGANAIVRDHSTAMINKLFPPPVSASPASTASSTSGSLSFSIDKMTSPEAKVSVHSAAIVVHPVAVPKLRATEENAIVMTSNKQDLKDKAVNKQELKDNTIVMTSNKQELKDKPVTKQEVKDTRSEEDMEEEIIEEVQILTKECCIRRLGLARQSTDLVPIRMVSSEMIRGSVSRTISLPNQQFQNNFRKATSDVTHNKSHTKTESRGKNMSKEGYLREENNEDRVEIIVLPQKHRCCSGKCMRTLNTLKPDEQCPHCEMQKNPHTCCDRRCEIQAGNMPTSPTDRAKLVCCSGVCERPRTNPTFAALYEYALSAKLSTIAKEELDLEEATKAPIETVDASTTVGKPKQTKKQREDFIRRRIEWKKRKAIAAKEAKRKKIMEQKEKKRLQKKHKHLSADMIDTSSGLQSKSRYEIVEEDCCKGTCKGGDTPPWLPDPSDIKEVGELEERITVLDPGVPTVCPTCHEYIATEEGVCCNEDRECCQKENVIVRKIIRRPKKKVKTPKEESSAESLNLDERFY